MDSLPPYVPSALDRAKDALNGALLKPFRQLPREAAPTLSFNTSALSGAQTIPALASIGGPANTNNFSYSGIRVANIVPRSTVFPGYNVATPDLATADTYGATTFTQSFDYIGAGTFDIIRYGDASNLMLLVDDVFVGFATQAVATGTAQAAASGTITLASGSSAVAGFYNQCYVRVTGGTGAGQIRQVASYNATTKVATTDTAWTTTPDTTSTYAIEYSPIGFSLDALTGSIKYLNVAFPNAAPAQPIKRKITIIANSFYGLNIGPYDTISPAPPLGQLCLLIVGDSYWDETCGPLAGMPLCYQLGLELGLQTVKLSSGSTGLWTRGSNNRLNFLNRIAPPAEAWRVNNPVQKGATGGTWTISVTYNGVTATTAAIPYNTYSPPTVENALNALTFGAFAASSGVSFVGPSGQGCFCVARGDTANASLIIIANGMVGATISVSSANLTGYTIPAPVPYQGDVAANLPLDANGNALPFVLLVPGSGNDPVAAGYTNTLLQANAITLAQAIVARFPTAIPIFTGTVTNSDGTGGAGTITSTETTRSAALKAGAAYLPQINNRTPFIDTYSQGVGGNCLFTGGGNVGAPTSGKNDVMKSTLATGHPTGLGVAYLVGNIANRVLELFRGQTDG